MFECLLTPVVVPDVSQIEENTKALESMGLRPGSAGYGLESPTRSGPAQRTVTSPTSASPAPSEPRAPARDRTGARKALLQWAQSTTKK